MELPIRPWAHVRKYLAGAYQLERGILVALLLSALSFWGYAELADEVLERETRDFDTLAIAFLHGPGGIMENEKVRELVRDVSALGSWTVIGLIVTFVCGYLFIIGDSRAGVFVLGAVFSGIAVSQGLKALIARPRPATDIQLAQVFSESFPSGHALLSAVVYLTLASLLARLHRSNREKVFFMGAAIVLTVLVGLSRIALGVHWPTDVLAGWALGASWALLCWVVFLLLQRRGAVERAHS